LTASAVVSSWTIAATLLSSTSCRFMGHRMRRFLEFTDPILRWVLLWRFGTILGRKPIWRYLAHVDHRTVRSWG
jgi:hypothetical protein